MCRLFRPAAECAGDRVIEYTRASFKILYKFNYYFNRPSSISHCYIILPIYPRRTKVSYHHIEILDIGIYGYIPRVFIETIEFETYFYSVLFHLPLRSRAFYVVCDSFIYGLLINVTAMVLIVNIIVVSVYVFWAAAFRPIPVRLHCKLYSTLWTTSQR